MLHKKIICQFRLLNFIFLLFILFNCYHHLPPNILLKQIHNKNSNTLINNNIYSALLNVRYNSTEIMYLTNSPHLLGIKSTLAAPFPPSRGQQRLWSVRDWSADSPLLTHIFLRGDLHREDAKLNPTVIHHHSRRCGTNNQPHAQDTSKERKKGGLQIHLDPDN